MIGTGGHRHLRSLVEQQWAALRVRTATSERSQIHGCWVARSIFNIVCAPKPFRHVFVSKVNSTCTILSHRTSLVCSSLCSATAHWLQVLFVSTQRKWGVYLPAAPRKISSRCLLCQSSTFSQTAYDCHGRGTLIIMHVLRTISLSHFHGCERSLPRLNAGHFLLGPGQLTAQRLGFSRPASVHLDRCASKPRGWDERAQHYNTRVPVLHVCSCTLHMESRFTAICRLNLHPPTETVFLEREMGNSSLCKYA